MRRRRCLARTRGVGWVRRGYDIKYYRTSEDFYSLTWNMTFPCDNDVCYVAYCYPYVARISRKVFPFFL